MRKVLTTLVLLAALGALLFFWGLPAIMAKRSDNAIWYGRREAAEHGCLNCHSAPANKELTNPGSPFGTVPSFAGGNLMMYVDRPAEVEEWIRNGFTKARRDNPEAWAKYRAQLIQMPAFGRQLDDDEVAALKAFVLATDDYLSPEESRAQHGEEIARAQCLSCHGAGGSGGLANPGSPFGYIPGWFGKDFHDLVKNEDELREWITTGSSRRVAALPLATWFWRRQAIQMPGFGQFLSKDDVDALVAYIAWLGQTDGGTRLAGEAKPK